jgi:diguanylate cyclase (GGDEF)-like protein/PAS domain S-box-containing protein
LINSNNFYIGILKILGTTALFYFAGQLAMPLAAPPSYAGAIWPPAGIGLAAVLLWGNRVLPGIFVAELIINYQIFDHADLAGTFSTFFLFIIAGFNSALRSWLGAVLIRKFIGFPNLLIHPKQIFGFVFFGGPCATLIPSLVGVVILHALGIVSDTAFLISFLTWWLGDSIGVAIFSPLFFIVFNRSCKTWRDRGCSVGLPLMVTLLMATIACFYAQGREQDRLKQEFYGQSKKTAHSLDDRIAANVGYINVLQSFFKTTLPINRKEFHTITNAWLGRNQDMPSLRVQWISKIEIPEQTNDGKNFLSRFKTKFSEPEITTNNFIPIDTANIHRAILTAWKPGQAAAATMMHLKDSNVVLFYQALYKSRPEEWKDSATKNQALENLTGFIVVLCDLNDLVNGAYNRFHYENLIFKIWDETPGLPTKLIYQTSSIQPISDPLQLTSRFLVTIPGRIWTLEAIPTAAYLGQNYSWTVWAVLAGTMLFTGLLSIGLLMLTGQAALIREKVDKRTEELNRTNKKLAASESQFRQLVQLQSAIVWRVDPKTFQFTFVSDEAQTILGYPPEQWVREKGFWPKYIYADDLWAIDFCHQQMHKLQDYEFEYRMVASDGRLVWLRDFVNLKVEEGEVKEMVGFMIDITDQKSAEEQLRLAATTFESMQGIIITDKNARILRVNKAFTEISGYSAEEAIGKNPSFLKSGRHEETYYKELWQQLNETGRFEGEIWNRHKNGEIYPLWQTISAVKNERGETTHYVSVFSDITEKKEAETRIHSLAFYDPLTGLPNRRLLLDRLEHELATARRHDKFGCIIFLDLDRFKVLNDSLGHHIGDELLVQVAIRLEVTLREEDTPSRLGGDEFVILVPANVDSLKEAGESGLVIAEKIKNALEQPYYLNEYEHHFTCSIGITLFPEAEEKPDDLIQQADTAMYRSKASGRNTISFFHPSMRQDADVRLFLEKELRNAINEGRFILYFQPQVDEKGTVIGAETLLRWLHAEKGIISSADFIPIAEETGLIIQLGSWVLKETCRQIKKWEKDGIKFNHVAVNVSSRQFRQKGFVDEVIKIVEDSGVSPHKIVIELTERVVIDDIDDTICKMQALKDFGVRISIDDFGTGYSSLAYLKQLPLDQLKIDQSFVRDISLDPSDAVIVETIIDMAKNLGLEVIAEGVETKAQVKFLQDKGCVIFQGYYFGYPVSAKDFVEQNFK